MITAEYERDDVRRAAIIVAEAIAGCRRKLEDIADRHGETGLHQVAMDALDDLEAEVAAILGEHEHDEHDDD